MSTSVSKQVTLDRILTFVAEHKASDLHLSVGNPPILRVDRGLVTLSDEPVLTEDFMEELSSSFLDEPQKEILKRDKEIVVAKTFKEKFRFKIHIFFQKNYLSASLRFIPSQVKLPQELGLPPVVNKFMGLKKGLIIIAGTYGSGRSSTAASLIETINQERSAYIVTIEKPIEYIFTNAKSVIEQREVPRDAVSFTKALEAVSEEDADVVYVSTLEGQEVISEIIEVAESGHLVMVISDTPSAFKTLEKIITSFSEAERERIRGSLADNLEGIISQRLLPRVGGGQILATEILVPTEASRLAIREGTLNQIDNILFTSREEGMVSLDRSLADLVSKGEILLEDAVKEAQDLNNLKMMIRR